ncbi:DUF3618 domain-containing protein [Arachnia propionica]|jgi:hypothetical protein|uniref:DUF3618 domain-containing protein n=1 Tax=Arachnia propionica TaxID=1750 RepID=A0A3N4CXY4_9ACTN|nr:DUF3618 domain-containing protein [Arachnia propionica]AFN46426.1 hypothetical protein HMPREF9154_0996 [Arachnia propionica F0230a]QCT37369.1 DUF3618 domain-containing protein [Arachnia propionica]QUC10285.1 DUF3618 domain-containing protein [Arachnia propionica]QUC15030.1 DUF3618 domain-containing protein [Arachnia propionica]RPA17187.1 DUF3618 domain-containing protein [Arachnia propionica]
MDSDTTRTVDEIRAELASNRQSLAGAMEDLVDSVKPANIARRGIDDAKSFVAGEFQTIKEELRDEDGWRTDRLAIIGGALLGVALFAVTIYVLGRRNHE